MADILYFPEKATPKQIWRGREIIRKTNWKDFLRAHFHYLVNKCLSNQSQT